MAANRSGHGPPNSWNKASTERNGEHVNASLHGGGTVDWTQREESRWSCNVLECHIGVQAACGMFVG